MTRTRHSAALAATLSLLAAGLIGCPSGTTATLSDASDNTNASDSTGDTGNPTGGNGFEIEPDDFVEGDELTEVSEYVTLYTTTADNEIVELFVVTANEDKDHAATGEMVFGHANIPFFNNDRRLRVQFVGTGTEVTLVFINGEAFDSSTARLEAYDADDKLIDEYVTDAILPGQSEAMTVSGNMKYAIAYLADGDGSFGRFDLLTFNTSGVSD